MRSSCKYIQVRNDPLLLTKFLSCSYFSPNQNYLRFVCLTKVGTIGRIAAGKAELAQEFGSAVQNFRHN